MGCLSLFDKGKKGSTFPALHTLVAFRQHQHRGEESESERDGVCDVCGCNKKKKNLFVVEQLVEIEQLSRLLKYS